MLDKFKGLALSLALCLPLATNASFYQLDSFGDNPGELTASYFKPEQSKPSLLVMLHGCGQNGKTLATDTGLIGLSTQYNFTVLIPQQSKSNNITACFNWFSEKDNAMGVGETLSLKNMINALIKQHGFKDIYIAGLSAGGAMTSSMLLNYPELFEAGAVIAGVPYPCANGLIKAISCMKNGPSSQTDLIQGANAVINQKTKLPRLTIWTGANDNIVNPKNSSALAKQWQHLTQITAQPEVTAKNGVTKQQWFGKDKQRALELVTIANVGHGIMVNPDINHGGVEGDYLLKSPIATMPEIIQFFGLKTKITK
ncbi:PHB depolymerase family esterase [Thalassotalea sp. M1531]|uniref:PHB depolymerase family esterase n=1 Tax=Thalassotalea algicola TaxID=2716224 RepID=A0A7Y0LCX6_9GAMM|nr:PHB depolymerase family esterase [Thalassotalea algicola]NMP31812.1 PHB depolymerase family esterase [Thalassotalea algicola]